LPLAALIRKPVCITIHHTRPKEYMRRFMSLFRSHGLIAYVAASEAQRTLLPDLNYAATIHHGIDPEQFAFDPEGGEGLMWAGRAIPEKGMDAAADAAMATRHGLRLFGIPNADHAEWLRTEIIERIASAPDIELQMGRRRHELIPYFQSSKAFILPVVAEEAFGLVFIEAMSCGTPVIAYAKGSVPEVIEDGVTGFVVNASADDVRGDWVVKKTGVEGLKEAIERLYAMPADDYRAMRRACRERVLGHFSIERMVDSYIHVYRDLIATPSSLPGATHPSRYIS